MIGVNHTILLYLNRMIKLGGRAFGVWDCGGGGVGGGGKGEEGSAKKCEIVKFIRLSNYHILEKNKPFISST